MQTDFKKPILATYIKIPGSFLIFFNTWGLLLSFGVFQKYYEESILRKSSPASISWIGTLSIFLLLVCGVVSGPAYDQGYERTLLISGHVLILLGIFMLSLSTQEYQIFLTQGVCFGLGAGLLYVPSLAGISKAFSQHRALAIGIAMSGASVGGIIFSIMLEQLLPRMGFAWTIRIVGFVMLFTTAMTLLTMLPGPVFKAPKRRALLDVHALKDVPFMTFSIGGLFVLFAYYLPFIYIPTVAARAGASSDLQFYLLSIINGASLLGRIVPSFAADAFGPLQSVPVAQTCAAIVLFCWPAVSSVPGLIVWSCFWGFFSGMLIVMPGAAIPQLSPSLGLIGTWMGMAWTISAVGFLIGGPIGGAIVADGSLVGMQVLAGAAMLGGAGLCGVTAFVKQRQEREAYGDLASKPASSHPVNKEAKGTETFSTPAS